MKRWEYRVVVLDINFNCRDTEERLNDFGKSGWEMVSINNNRIYFKRELQEEEE